MVGADDSVRPYAYELGLVITVCLIVLKESIRFYLYSILTLLHNGAIELKSDK